MMRRNTFHALLSTTIVAGALVGGAGSARGEAPPGHFADNKDGTVSDNKTGLVWQQGIDPNAETWQSAITYCKNLGLAGGGWRLPSVKELMTIVDRRQANPAIDQVVFPNTPVDDFWSSSPLAGGGISWRVDFHRGYAGGYEVGNTIRVRCVR